MYKVLVADDETIVRENICALIPWTQMELLLSDTAENGKEAAEKVEKQRPDIILTDIMMPHLNGLEFVKRIKSCDYDPLIVIITGYDEFEYAHTAIRLGVFDYLLKPVDRDALCQVLLKATADLDSRRAALSETEEMRRRIREKDLLPTQKAFQNYLNQRIDAKTVADRLPVGIPPDGWFSCLLLRIDDFDSQTSKLSEEEIFTMTQSVEEWIYQSSFRPLTLVEESGGRYILIHAGKTCEDVRLARNFLLRALRDSTDRPRYTTVCAPICEGIEQVAASYQEAVSALYCAFLTDGDIDLADTDIRESETPLPDINTSVITQSIATFDKVRIKQDFDRFEEDLRSAGHNSFLFMRIAVSYVYSEIMKQLTELHYPVQNLLDDSAVIYHKILQCQTLSKAMEELYRFVERICDALPNEKSSNQAVVNEAKIYMQKHYRNAKLTLEMVASAVGLSPNYFSLLFKQTAGQPFIRYLTEIRLTQAKKLLMAGNYRAYEIAYLCGYDNPTYFSTIFKKQTGITPSEFGSHQHGQ